MFLGFPAAAKALAGGVTGSYNSIACNFYSLLKPEGLFIFGLIQKRSKKIKAPEKHHPSLYVA